MKRIVIIVVAILVLVGVGWVALGPIGFGVFGGSAESLELIEFSDDAPAQSSSSTSVSVPVSDFYEIPGELLIEVDYMFAHVIYLRVLSRLNQDLITLSESRPGSEFDLDWVVEVHELTLEAENIYRILSAVRVPRTNEHVYLDYKLRMLEVVQVSAEGATRLLAASVLLGPSGRSSLNLSVTEKVEFDSLLRQSSFYLEEAAEFLEDEQERVSSAVSTISLR